MYRIPNDKRAYRSARTIFTSLKALLKEQDYSQISVSDLIRHADISRMTFYRLFDSLDDVLYYQCDQAFETILQTIAPMKLTARETIRLGIQLWMEHEELIHVLTLAGRLDLLYELFRNNSRHLKIILEQEPPLSQEEADYFTSMISVLIPTVIRIWVSHDRRESPEQILQMVRRSFTILMEAIDQD